GALPATLAAPWPGLPRPARAWPGLPVAALPVAGFSLLRLRSGLVGLKPRPSSWSRRELLIAVRQSVVRRRRFFAGVGIQQGAQLLEVGQGPFQAVGEAGGFQPRFGQ